MTVRTILHVDMDSFYASVETLRDPTLAGRPVIVGGTGSRGVVASCNYEARVHGVHSAMPSLRAKRLCPDAVFLAGDFRAYSDYSKRMHEVFRAFTPLVEGISLDEAFLDVTGASRLFGDGQRIAHAVRGRIAQDVGLPCAVGVATCKLVAKLASKAAKPTVVRRRVEPGSGVVVVPPGGEVAFLHPLPVGALWGVGPATQRRLGRFGVRTIGELARLPLDTLTAALGPALGRHLHDLAWGRDDRPVVVEARPKSVGHEETYAHDLHDHDELGREAVRLADSVASRLRHAGLEGRTVTIKVRFHDFRTITRSRTLPSPTAVGPAIADAAKELLGAVDPASGVRLFGISVSNLAEPATEQLGFDALGATDEAWSRATRAVDEVRQRFGHDAVAPAALARGGRLRVKRRGDTQWGPNADHHEAG